jgi:hypothetical protein
MESCERNAKVELEHILLELKNGRTQHMRSFIDQYYCFKNGFINKNGGAAWSKINWNRSVSVKAALLKDEYEKKIMQSPNDKAILIKTLNSNITRDHVIPIKFIANELAFKFKENPKLELDEIAQILDERLFFATILKEENEKITRAGLRDKMPKAFFDKKHQFYNSWKSRYNAVGIAIVGEC